VTEEADNGGFLSHSTGLSLNNSFKGVIKRKVCRMWQESAIITF